MYSFTFAKVILYIIALTVPNVNARGNNQVDAEVQGDQTVGGIHLFEVHTPGGGMGIGIKVMLVCVVLAIVGYWWLRRRAKKALQRTLAAQGLSALGGNQFQMHQLQMPNQYQVVPMTHMPAPVHQAPNRPKRGRDRSPDNCDSSAFRLP